MPFCFLQFFIRSPTSLIRLEQVQRERERENQRSVEGGDAESDIRCPICRYQVYADIRCAQNTITIHSSCLAALSTFIHDVQIALKLIS